MKSNSSQRPRLWREIFSCLLKERPFLLMRAYSSPRDCVLTCHHSRENPNPFSARLPTLRYRFLFRSPACRMLYSQAPALSVVAVKQQYSRLERIPSSEGLHRSLRNRRISKAHYKKNSRVSPGLSRYWQLEWARCSL